MATTTTTTSLVQLPAAEQQEGGFFLVESREQFDDIMSFVAQQVAGGFTVVATATPPPQNTAAVATATTEAEAVTAPSAAQHVAVPDSLGGHSLDELRQSVGIREVELIRNSNVIAELSASIAQYSMAATAAAPPPTPEETAASLAFLNDLGTVDVTPVPPGDEGAIVLRTSGGAVLSSISLADSVDMLSSWVVIEHPRPTPTLPVVDESGEWPTRNDDHDEPMEAALLATTTTTTTTTITTTAQQQQQLSFFHNWPSFGVTSKLQVVVGFACGSAAWAWGFMSGVNMMTRMLGLLFEDYVIRSGFSYAVILGALLNPEVILTAVGSVMIAGVAVGAASSIPIFVIGSSGVFVSAAIYHAWEAARRVVTGDRGTGSQ